MIMAYKNIRLFLVLSSLMAMQIFATQTADTRGASSAPAPWAFSQEKLSPESSTDEDGKPWGFGQSVLNFLRTRNTMYDLGELQRLRQEQEVLVKGMVEAARGNTRDAQVILQRIDAALESFDAEIKAKYATVLSKDSSSKVSEFFTNAARFLGIGKGVFGSAFAVRQALLEDKAELEQLVGILNSAIALVQNTLSDIDRCIEVIKTWQNFKKVVTAIKETEQRIDDARTWKEKKKSAELQLEDLLRFTSRQEKLAEEANSRGQRALWYRLQAVQALTTLMSRQNPKMKDFMNRYNGWLKEEGATFAQRLRMNLNSLFEWDVLDRADKNLNPRITLFGEMGRLNFFPFTKLRVENILNGVIFLPGGWITDPDKFGEYDLRATRLAEEAARYRDLFVGGYRAVYDFATTQKSAESLAMAKDTGLGQAVSRAVGSASGNDKSAGALRARMVSAGPGAQAVPVR